MCLRITIAMKVAPGQFLLMAAGVSGLLAVAFGAFGAHGLRGRVSPDLLAVWHTAVEYQFWHTLALIACAILALRQPQLKGFVYSGCWFLAGIIIFSGSLYALTLTGLRWLGAVTPVGGVAFLVGWAVFIYAAGRTTLS